MKVLIETITNRRGYKLFEGIDEFNDFLLVNRSKINKFQIIEDKENAVNQLLQGLADECKRLNEKLLYVYFQKLGQQSKYEKLIYASGRVYDALVAVKECMQ